MSTYHFFAVYVYIEFYLTLSIRKSNSFSVNNSLGYNILMVQQTEQQISQAWTLWAKTGKKDQPHVYLPLLTHLIDVGAAAYELLLREPASTRALFAEDYALNETEGLALVSALVALHDLGKASPTFQNLWFDRPHPLPEEDRLLSQPCKKVGHGQVTHLVLADFLGRMGLPLSQAERLAQAVGSHHGITTSPRNITSEQLGGKEWDKARWWLFRKVMAACGVTKLSLAPRFSPEGYMRLAGLTSVADWIGSSFDIPEMLDEEPLKDPAAYFLSARKKAAAALDQIGWNTREPLLDTSTVETVPAPAELFSYFPHFEPRALQTLLAEKLEAMSDQPTLILIEAPMGEGKTEAALHAATVLQKRLGHRGIYLALPTMATGNAMYARFAQFLVHTSKRDVTPDLQLMHGGQLLNKAYQNALQITKNIQNKRKNNESLDPAEEGVVRAESWFSARKRAALSEYGVGTLDQALLGVLDVRHQWVRLWGMGNRVVILDEIHAYDTYTSELMIGLLGWLRKLGSSVILMSATLPPESRRRLLEVWNGSVDIMGQEKETPPYPRLSLVAGENYRAYHISGTRSQPDIHLEVLEPSVEAVARQAISLVKVGGCVVVIANTVSRAQAIYDEIKNAWDGRIRTLTQAGAPEDLCLLLFHARFPAYARQTREEKVLERLGKDGKRPQRMILVATQVAEQSLDFDADAMISDLAPVDLLLQRAGRLHRHRQNDDRRRGHTKPTLWVAGLDTWPREAMETYGWRYVYEPSLLYRTWLALRGMRRVALPTDLDRLVAQVYSDQPLPANEMQAKELAKATFGFQQRQGNDRIYAGLANIGRPEHFFDRFIEQKNLPDPDGEYAHDDPTPDSSHTRLGREGVRVIPVIRENGAWVLETADEESRPSACLRKGKLSGVESAALFRRSVVLSNYWVVKTAEKTAEAAGLCWDAWKRDALLYGCVPLPFRDGCCVLEGASLVLELDEERGIVYIQSSTPSLPSQGVSSMPRIHVTNPANIRQTFLELTALTCPAGSEHDLYGNWLMSTGWQEDGCGNWYKQIGESDTAFTAHLDDAGWSGNIDHITHVWHDKNTVGTDENTILGADCKAGVAILLKMIEQGVAGLYVLFHSEEVGRVGSTDAAESGSLPLDGIQKMVSFDRRGYNSVITHQWHERCASQEFAAALSRALNVQMQTLGACWNEFQPDPTGSYTDSVSFAHLIPECTNLSVGYADAHSMSESQNLAFLEYFAQACCRISWKDLPVGRVINEEETRDEEDDWN